MVITLGTDKNSVKVNVDPRIKSWFIACNNKPSLHLEFDEGDFGSYENVVAYAEELGKELNGVTVDAFGGHLAIILSELEDKGGFLRM